MEALCFDLFVEQPWVIIRRAIGGLDAQITKLEEAEEKERANTEGVNGAQGKRQGPKITEELIVSLAWPISSEAFVYFIFALLRGGTAHLMFLDHCHPCPSFIHLL